VGDLAADRARRRAWLERRHRPVAAWPGRLLRAAVATHRPNECGSINQQVKTLVHELAHALVRVETDDAQLPFRYAEEELVVESVAFTVWTE
jgi:hypothetical protein